MLDLTIELMVYDWLAFERVLQIKFRGILSFHVRIFSMQTNLDFSLVS